MDMKDGDEDDVWKSMKNLRFSKVFGGKSMEKYEKPKVF